jgi:C4-dicarboxylate transporter DctM subunit
LEFRRFNHEPHGDPDDQDHMDLSELLAKQDGGDFLRGVAEAVASMGLGPLGLILVVMAMIFIMGMFFESIAIILITTPILLPTMIALDIDLVWYGVLLMINLELAMITPPVGMNLFVIKGITDAPLSEVVRGAAPYVFLMILGLALMILVPGLATWLPYSTGFGR